MAIKFFKAPTLPGTPTNADNGIWFVKPNGSNPMKIYLMHNGTPVSLDAVDAATLATALALKADDNAVVKLAGTQTITGSKTFNAVPKIGQDATGGTDAVRKSQLDSLLANKADDNAVVKLAGNQTVNDIKTFTVPPKFNADASSATDGVRKGQLDTLLAAINQAIADLQATVVDGLAPPVDIDCSGNPNYPAADVGDRFIVTADGRIGGASGIEVTVGDLIVCKATTSGGTQATSGDKFYILQTNVHDATTTVKGLIQLATQAEVDTGTNTTKAVTPATLATRLAALSSTIDSTILATTESRYVRYDQSQSLTTAQKTFGRNNIEAAKDSEVVKTTGNQTVAGTKTFSSPVKVPTAIATDDAVNKGQMDAGLATKANDADVVKLTGNQTVNGKKTFGTVPASNQDATGANDLVRKSQAEAMMASATLEWTTDNWT